MYGVTCLVFVGLVLCADGGRHKRIVGGDKANPPPPGASEAEDIVENPALVSVQPTRPTTTTTTRRPTRPVELDDGPIVFLRRGRREARVEGSKDGDGVYSFQGLRYAQPPVSQLRFQRPTQVKPEGDVNATTPGPPCPQTIGQRVIGSEDCLFLNVYSPEIPRNSSAKKYPVLFWIHGGGFRRGSGSQYGPKALVKKGLVVVTIQYRLGSLGFLSTNRKELPGNAGLFDIASSLRWVRRYIDAFGGDRNHIIPSGQGSGASAAQMLALNQYSKGWIKGVFAMSGSSISSFAVDKTPEESARNVSEVNNCHSITESLAFVRCMQKLPLDNIIKGDDKVQDNRLSSNNKADSYLTSISKLLNPGPAVEGEDDFRFLPNFLTASPQQSLEKGDFANVPLLTGVTKDETSTSAKGGGLASSFLGQVEASQELLDNIVTKLIQINTGFIGGDLLNPLAKSLTSSSNNLLKLSKGVTSSLKGATSTLDKIIEVTTDALFNFPAFLTSQKWSKKSKAYMYSFEHESDTTTSDDFLQENPLTEQNKPVEGVGHGDDLIYLFDLLPLEGGEPTESSQLTKPDDMKVRETFTDMVAEFARTGEPRLNGETAQPFSTDGGDYMVISSNSTMGKGFRKCQMGLWAGLDDVLKSAECSSLQLGDLTNNLGLDGVTSKLGDTTGGLPVLVKPEGGGLLGGGSSSQTQKPGGIAGLLGSGSSSQTQKPGGIGGFLGSGSSSQTQKPLGGLLG